jgi:hypothetical protein
MGILILILLLLLALTGGWFLLKVVLGVALGVVLGLFLAVALLGAVVAWRIRRALYGPRPRWRRVRGSRVEVLDRDAGRDER